MAISIFKYTEVSDKCMETLTRSESYEEYIKAYRDRFMGYEVEMFKDEQERDLRRHSKYVTIKTRRGEEFSTNFITNVYIRKMMRRWKKSGDYARGSYFPTAKVVLVRNLKENTIKKTIDDIIDSLAVEEFFVKQQT